jgi:hypothetical protein
MGIKYSLKDVNAVAIERGGICLSEEYINFQSLMKWRCAKGHEWQARFFSIKTGKRWCPYCAENAPHTIGEARQIAHSKNGQCLSEKYYNIMSPLLWECFNGMHHLIVLKIKTHGVHITININVKVYVVKL